MTSKYEVQVKISTRRWEPAAMRLFTFPFLAARVAERHAREVESETRVVEVQSGKVVARFRPNEKLTYGR